ncbi:hypothetical protein BC828DRAFT_407982 [Blastocladiella britannica]|nr:hypothetical protein BC828DRAFT_407982 [Blastocladiella britannica]
MRISNLIRWTTATSAARVGNGVYTLADSVTVSATRHHQHVGLTIDGGPLPFGFDAIRSIEPGSTAIAAVYSRADQIAILAPSFWWAPASGPTQPLGSPAHLATLVPLSPRPETAAIARALDQGARPPAQALLTLWHPHPLVLAAAAGSPMTKLTTDAHARLDALVAARFPPPHAVDQICQELMQTFQRDGWRGPSLELLAAVVEEAVQSQKVKEDKEKERPRSTAGYHFKAQHGTQSGTSRGYDHSAKMDPSRIYGPGGLDMNTIMGKVRAATAADEDSDRKKN